MINISRTPFKFALAPLVLALGTTVAAAQSGSAPGTGNPAMNPSTSSPGARSTAKSGDAAKDAASRVHEATSVVRKMESDPAVKSMLEQSKGVLIMPRYGRAALGVGGQGGTGVLLVHRDGKWTGPGFYNFGGLSIGAQAGAEGGQIAFILTDSKALRSFATNNKFSLNADAGLTIVDYSKRKQGSAGRGDVVVWSDTKGAFADLSVGVTDVNFDEDETHAYYGRPVDARQIVNSGLSSQKAENLLDALPG